jgi:hypothetical protein
LTDVIGEGFVSEKKFSLVVSILYIVLILISLGDPAMVLTIGRAVLGGRTELVLSLIPYGIISFLLVYLTFVSRESRARRFLLLMVVSVVTFFIIRYLHGESEKMHLTEFALLGALLFWTATEWGFNRHAAYLLVATAGSMTVVSEELIRISLSLGMFTIRDILVNIMSVALGAVLYAGLFVDYPRPAKEAGTST